MERDAVESLFNGDPRQPIERDVLLRLLSAATAPARPYELAGEDAAVRAFQQPAQTPLRRPGRRAFLAKLLTVKVAVAVAVTAVGGATVAAATGALPNIPGTAGFGARPTTPAPPATASRNSTNKGAGGPGAPATSPSTAPSRSLADLCRAFVTDVETKPPKDREKTKQQDLKDPIFAPLVTAAGGKGKTMPYCVRLLQTPGVGDTAPPGVSPTSRPTNVQDGNQDGNPQDLTTQSTPDKAKTPRPHQSKAAHQQNAGPPGP